SPAVPGDGPPFVAPMVDRADVSRPLSLRLTNTGTAAWPRGTELAAGWDATEEPYLVVAPSLQFLDVDVPALGVGEAVDLAVRVPPPDSAVRNVLWLTLVSSGRSLADLGSPPLELATVSR
ncbi:MAG: hypothetical protein ABR509_08005, partial [Candidatus Limnocylindria bacterium]